MNNLLDNAIYYSPNRGTVTLHTCIITHENCAPGSSSAGRILQFTVSDEGCGFSTEALRLGTEEFYRDDTSRSDSSHFGMGFTIVKQLVNVMGGTLILGNRPEGGGIVTVELPI